MYVCTDKVIGSKIAQQGSTWKLDPWQPVHD